VCIQVEGGEPTCGVVTNRHNPESDLAIQVILEILDVVLFALHSSSWRLLPFDILAIGPRIATKQIPESGG
jgi:hypothetical protein